MVAAVLQRYPAPSPITVISAATTTKPCANGTAACPVPPPTGTFLGTVVVGLRGGGQDDLDAWQVNGEVQLVLVAQPHG